MNSGSEGALRVGVIDFAKDTRVVPFLVDQMDSLIYHYPCWLSALQDESGQPCLMLAAESSDGSLCGVTPLAYTRGLPIDIFKYQTRRRLSSLPRTPFVGPISIHPAATRLMLSAAIDRAETENVHLQIKTARPLPDGGHEKLVCTEWRPTYVLALPESTDQLSFGNSRDRHKLKWGVNKARKLGLSLRLAGTEADLTAWYSLYLTTMRRNFAPPRSLRFFLSLWRQLGGSSAFKLLLAERATSSGVTLVAGSIFLMMGKICFYAFTGSLTKQLGMHANDLILWEAIHKACADGYRSFDFGEVPEEHPELVRFKTKWGAVPRPLYRYYFPSSERNANQHAPYRMRNLLTRVWQNVPLSLTARAGEWLYSYL